MTAEYTQDQKRKLIALHCVWWGSVFAMILSGVFIAYGFYAKLFVGMGIVNGLMVLIWNWNALLTANTGASNWITYIETGVRWEQEQKIITAYLDATIHQIEEEYASADECAWLEYEQPLTLEKKIQQALQGVKITQIGVGSK